MLGWFRKLDETVQMMVSVNALLFSFAAIVFIGGPLYSGKFDTLLTSEAIFLIIGMTIATIMVNRYSNKK